MWTDGRCEKLAGSILVQICQALGVHTEEVVLGAGDVTLPADLSDHFAQDSFCIIRPCDVFENVCSCEPHRRTMHEMDCA